MVPINVKDQFICELFNTTLETDILAKAAYLKTLEEIVKHAEVFETALHDLSKLNEIANPLISHISDCHCQCQSNPSKPERPCPGCGSTSHGAPERNDQSSKCPAWGKNCLNSNIPNHFARVCQKEKQTPDIANTLIAHVHYD